MHRAIVIERYEGRKFVGLFVEITAVDDDIECPTVISSIPCANDTQAWAVCDAFNYPDRNTNDWRALDYVAAA